MREALRSPRVKTATERESSFELLRLIAMFTIVMYHFYQHHVYPEWGIPFNQAIQMVVHTGVPIFVLISGYWGIKVSGGGLARLLGQTAVYTIPILLIYNHLINGG